MNQLLIATGNDSKVDEIAHELEPYDLNVTSPGQRGFGLNRPESGRTYHENARIKAEEGYDKSGLPSLADDSGLEVDGLDGKPGVKSDRWAGEDATTEDKIQKLLNELDGVADGDRTARFVCSMVLFDETGERLHTRGSCEGRIANEPTGDGGFGYDPIFEVKRADFNTFAELDESVKQWLSHRAIALNEMISRMKSEELLGDEL